MVEKCIKISGRATHRVCTKTFDPRILCGVINLLRQFAIRAMDAMGRLIMMRFAQRDRVGFTANTCGKFT